MATYALRKQILCGSLPVGARLPPEEKLAKQFGISRGTLRFALDDLQSEGLVERRRNFGCVVAKRRAQDSLIANTITLISNIAGGVEANLFTGRLASLNSGVADTVSAEGYNFMLVRSSMEVEDVIDRMIAERPFGVAISSLIGDKQRAATLTHRLQEAGVPVVIHSNEAPFRDVDRVISDHEQGTAELVRALAADGRKHILRVWIPDPQCWWIVAHDKGYESAICETGLTPLQSLYIPDVLRRDETSRQNFDIRVRQIVGFLLERHQADQFDAVIVSTDCEVPLVAAACRMIGLTPGKDVAICGYDNQWPTIHERQWEPAAPFASIDKQNHLIGEEMIHLLLDRATGRIDSPFEVRTVPQKLVRFDPSA